MNRRKAPEEEVATREVPEEKSGDRISPGMSIGKYGMSSAEQLVQHLAAEEALELSGDPHQTFIECTETAAISQRLVSRTDAIYNHSQPFGECWSSRKV